MCKKNEVAVCVPSSLYRLCESVAESNGLSTEKQIVEGLLYWLEREPAAKMETIKENRDVEKLLERTSNQQALLEVGREAVIDERPLPPIAIMPRRRSPLKQ